MPPGPRKLNKNLEEQIPGGSVRLNTNVRGSIESLFAHNQDNGIHTPKPPAFRFRADRSGRINWRMIMNASLNEIEAGDLDKLQELLQNIMYANLSPEDMDQFGDEYFIKLFRLCQMSMEYLVYIQNYLEALTKTLDMQYKNAFEQTKDIRDKIQRYNIEITNLKNENKLKRLTLQTYETLLKVPQQGDLTQAIRCKHCSKFFKNEDFLKKHYLKRHPNQRYENDYPSLRDVQRDKEGSQKEILEKQKKDQELIFERMKKELTDQMKASMSGVQDNLRDIKAEQRKLESIGEVSQSEQKRIDQNFQNSQALLSEYKEQWKKDLKNQTLEMNQMVQEKVKEALAYEKSRLDKQQSEHLDQRAKLEDANNQQIADQLSKYKQEFDKLNREVEMKDRKIKELNTDKRQVEMEKKLKEDKITQLQKQNDDLNQQMARVRDSDKNIQSRELTQLKEDKEKLEVELEKAQREVSEIRQKHQMVNKPLDTSGVNKKVDTNVAEARALYKKDKEVSKSPTKELASKNLAKDPVKPLNVKPSANMTETKPKFTNVNNVAESSEEYSMDEDIAVSQGEVQTKKKAEESLSTSTKQMLNQQIANRDSSANLSGSHTSQLFPHGTESKKEAQKIANIEMRKKTQNYADQFGASRDSKNTDHEFNEDLVFVDDRIKGLSKEETEKLNKEAQKKLKQKQGGAVDYNQFIEDHIESSSQSLKDYKKSK